MHVLPLLSLDINSGFLKGLTANKCITLSLFKHENKSH